eukprot:CAMPEP_0117006912 /NCGR_PEP_ID=MMETSP0472-20121206/6975_1 /TAXON_ID=693140 ORGANISM="Tiarina fusus, Strain LIS" /NCGR_SAMPLE_ID=MMETSP0472 /ASSEMBLY_ACC=CAM_ASM_000603 /LENGTH=130 /DNA_ID=CAMNT_0004708521 /DNA_START=37 /DNA_END=426 /DNA_ORIENTATION=+
MATSTKDSRTLISQLQSVESHIQATTQILEKAFKDASNQSVEASGVDIPDPIKLVRRLTALEMSLGHLKHDCAGITSHRNSIVGLVLGKQNRNLSQVEKMAEALERTTQCSVREDEKTADDSWDEIAHAW